MSKNRKNVDVSVILKTGLVARVFNDGSKLFEMEKHHVSMGC